MILIHINNNVTFDGRGEQHTSCRVNGRRSAVSWSCRFVTVLNLFSLVTASLFLISSLSPFLTFQSNLLTDELSCLGVREGLNRDAIRTPSGSLRWRPSASVRLSVGFCDASGSGLPGRLSSGPAGTSVVSGVLRRGIVGTRRFHIMVMVFQSASVRSLSRRVRTRID
jgi:hypothetical protein